MGLFGERCVRFNKKRTRRAFEGLPTCDECELQLKAAREETRSCPIDSAHMIKEVLMNVILDRCPTCHGVWLDGGELDIMKNAVSEEGGDFATGFLMGMVVG